MTDPFDRLAAAYAAIRLACAELLAAGQIDADQVADVDESLRIIARDLAFPPPD